MLSSDGCSSTRKLQLDASYASKMAHVLEQLAPRFQTMALELPRDEHNSTETVRRMLEEALTARLTDAKKKELTPEGCSSSSRCSRCRRVLVARDGRAVEVGRGADRGAEERGGRDGGGGGEGGLRRRRRPLHEGAILSHKEIVQEVNAGEGPSRPANLKKKKAPPTKAADAAAAAGVGSVRGGRPAGVPSGSRRSLSGARGVHP